MEEEKKLSGSRVKTLALGLLMLAVTGCTVLVDFVSAEFSTTIFTDATYWINMITMQSAVVILLFVERTVSKEKECGRNERYKMLAASLSEAFLSLNAQNLNGTFRAYIAEDNRARKLAAYLAKLNAKKARCDDRAARLGFRIRRIEIRAQNRQRVPRGVRYKFLCALKKRAEDKSAFWQKKIDRAPEEVDYVRVKFVRWSYGVIFSDAEGKAKEEDDPATHEGRDVASILVTKVLSILAIGLVVTSYVTPEFTFDAVLIYRTLIKLMQIALGLYTGAVSGQDFVRRKLCAKLMIRFNYVKQFKEKTAS